MLYASCRIRFHDGVEIGAETAIDLLPGNHQEGIGHILHCTPNNLEWQREANQVVNRFVNLTDNIIFLDGHNAIIEITSSSARRGP